MNTSHSRLDLRADFPALNQMVNGVPLVYFDNAATPHRPLSVIEATTEFYRHDNANVHRGVHTLSQRSTEKFESVRSKLAKRIGCQNPSHILWTKGCTEAINLIASTWGEANIQAGDEILISTMEHHANFVPWQMLAQRKGAVLVPIPISDAGEIDLETYESALNARTKLVAIKQICNALGTVNPIHQMVNMAHRHGAKVVVDGAQGLAHEPLDVREADLDFYAMSAHKAYGPTGVGALYVRPGILEEMPPYQYGGDMIRTVSWEKTTFNELPNRFEPGTPNIAGVIGFGAALDYLEGVGFDAIRSHERDLLEYGTERLQGINGLTIFGNAKQKACILSFALDGIHPHDIGSILDRSGIAIRTGHHCCMPLMKRLGVPALARASFAIYNQREEIDQLVEGLKGVQKVFA